MNIEEWSSISDRSIFAISSIGVRSGNRQKFSNIELLRGHDSHQAVQLRESRREEYHSGAKLIRIGFEKAATASHDWLLSVLRRISCENLPIRTPK